MAGRTPELSDVTPWCRRLVQATHSTWVSGSCLALGVSHWLPELWDRAPSLLAALGPEVDWATLVAGYTARRDSGDAAEPLPVPALIRAALDRAHDRQVSLATALDVARTVLATAAIELPVQPADSLDEALRGLSREDATPPALRQSPRDSDDDDDQPLDSDGAYSGRGRQRGSGMLAQYGHDLTAAASAGKLPPILGRENEIQLVIETLCRRTKRNPALIGPAGVGKTAIAEGLAQRIAGGEVPELLKGKRVIALPASSLVAGAGVVGELEQRMEKLLEEAKRRDVILFIDELHTIVGAGSSSTHRSGDVANMLKPGLARGDFACIAATTDDEYRQYIEPDSALERRFQPIRIQEMSVEQTLAILESLAEEFRRSHSVSIDGAILGWLLDFAGRFMHNRFFPDKAIDLLEQCVAHATAGGQKVVQRSDAEAVAQRMVGMPLDLDNRLGMLAHQLVDRALLPEGDAQALRSRLDVTLRGLDLRPGRPNAVVLLLGDAAAAAESLSATIAGTLYGGVERQIGIDLSGYVDPSHVSMLLGSGPGYVGYQDSLPLHKVAQAPWCVLRFDHIDACHPAVRDVIKQSLADGYLTMGDGKKIFISDAVVVLTAALSPEGRRTAGFRQHGDQPLDTAQIRALAVKSLGEAFWEEVDVTSAGGLHGADQRRKWLRDQILPALTKRYHDRRLNVTWDEGVLDWLAKKGTGSDLRDWERVVENQVAPLLIPYLPDMNEGEVALAVGVSNEGEPQVRLVGLAEGA